MARRSGRHGRRKVNVPNVVGTSRTAARGSFTTIGLDYSESSTSTSDISLSEITQSQSVVSGQTVLIGSTVPFVYYSYVAPTPVPAAPTPAPTPVPAAPTPSPAPTPVAGCNPPAGSICEVYIPYGSSTCQCYDGCYRIGRINSSCACGSLGGIIC